MIRAQEEASEVGRQAQLLQAEDLLRAGLPSPLPHFCTTPSTSLSPLYLPSLSLSLYLPSLSLSLDAAM